MNPTDQIGPVRHCSSRVLIETLNAVRIMMKSHDRRENEEPIYVAVCQCLELIRQSANSDGSLIANPENSLRSQPEPSLLGRETVREETIEECAKVCDRLRRKDYSAENEDWAAGTSDCAKAIRSLSP